MFHTLFYNPLYNLLIFIIDIIPYHNVGVAVILITIIVSLVLFKLSKKALRTQMKIRELQPEFDALKKIESKEERARKMLELYKTHKINPFLMIGTLILQIPIFIALSFIFFKGGLPEVQRDLLYSFITEPEYLNMHFLFTDIGTRSVWFGLLAGITQFIQAKIAISKSVKKERGTFKDDFTHSMNTQAKYTIPILTGVFAMSFPAALALYIITRNIFLSIQEVFIRRKKD